MADVIILSFSGCRAFVLNGTKSVRTVGTPELRREDGNGANVDR